MISKVSHDLHFSLNQPLKSAEATLQPKSATEIGGSLDHWDIEKYIKRHEYVDILFFGWFSFSQ